MPTIDARPESEFERILMATDFSPAADVALAYAIDIARRYLSTLELTTVIDLSMTVPALDVLSGPALDALRHSSDEDLQRLIHEVSGINITKNALEGFQPVASIINEAVNL